MSYRLDSVNPFSLTLTLTQQRPNHTLQSSRVLLDTPILAGLAAVHSNDHGFAIYSYSLGNESERVPPFL